MFKARLLVKKGNRLFSTGLIFGAKKKHISTDSETEISTTKMPSNENKSHIQHLLRNADAVCFDVDSTICKDEAIDELAQYMGVGEHVAQLTRKAMSQKNCEFNDSLRARLNAMKPSRKTLQDFIKRHPPKLTPGIRELVQILHDRGTHVYMITGGFDGIVSEVAKELGIPHKNVFANRFLFYFNGDYAGFDESQPTCRSGGKARVIKMLKEKHNYNNVIMIGDGTTDLEASPPADGFIGFGGNQVRANVQREAPWYIHSFKELTSVLQAAA